MASLYRVIESILEYCNKEYSYASKNKRMERLRQYTAKDWYELVIQIAVGCAYCQTQELFTSITGKLAYRLGWDNHREAICTMSELLVCFAQHDVIDIAYKAAGGKGRRYKALSIAIQANIPLSEELVRYVVRSEYLPPMVCEPEPVTHNNQSGYLTHDDSVVLNFRTDEPISLDVINRQNQTPLAIDLDFMLNNEQVSNKPLDTVDKAQDFANFTKLVKEFSLLLHHQSDANSEIPGALYLNHKYDTRGRMYCQGYHINYQGQPYQKACLDFAEPEYVDVPEEYRIAA